MLAGIDVLLVDLQDAGARYYTYITTTVEVMKAAAGKGIPVVLLDRPDPIGGAVQGNVLEEAHISPVGRLRVPMRHGLTLAEMARLARADLGIAGELRVVPVSGWRRAMAFDATGLPFVPPSPNLRTLESLFHYPGTCLFEGTNLSVGRGSDAPFEQVGSPWLDTAAVLSPLRKAALPGVALAAASLSRPAQPGDGKYADTLLARDPARGHRPRGVRPDRHRRPPSDGDQAPASHRARLDSDALRPPGRDQPDSGRPSRPARTRRPLSGAGKGSGGCSSSVGGRCCCTRSELLSSRAKRGISPALARSLASLGMSDDRRVWMTERSDCSKGFCRLSFAPANRVGAAEGKPPGESRGSRRA